MAQQSLNDGLVLAVLPQGRSRTVPQCLGVDANNPLRGLGEVGTPTACTGLMEKRPEVAASSLQRSHQICQAWMDRYGSLRGKRLEGPVLARPDKDPIVLDVLSL